MLSQYHVSGSRLGRSQILPRGPKGLDTAKNSLKCHPSSLPYPQGVRKRGRMTFQTKLRTRLHVDQHYRSFVIRSHTDHQDIVFPPSSKGKIAQSIKSEISMKKGGLNGGTSITLNTQFLGSVT